jgi:iron complex transport system ATP-binding protein
MSSLLNIKDLRVGYRNNEINQALVSDFTAQINPGERIAIMGLNGCGKSTLLRTISGMIPLLSGSIQIYKEDISILNGKEKSRLMATVFTRYYDPGKLTVIEMVTFGRYPYTNRFNKLTETDQVMIDNTLELAEIMPLKNRIIGELSDGERQKVMIAVAIAQDTPLLILDEPASHLDIRNKVLMMELIRKLGTDQQKTILFSTHDVGLTLKVATRVWLFHNKQIKDYKIDEFKQGEYWKLMLMGLDADMIF